MDEMDDVPDLTALRGARVASDAEYIEQLEQLSIGQERLAVELRERVGALELQAGDRERLLRDILQDMRAERDRLRAVVDAVVEFERRVPFFSGVVPGDPDNTEDEEARARIAAALDQLDGSAEATDG